MNTADPMVIEKFKNLPQKLKDALFSEDTTDTIFSVGKENGLTVFQMEELADEVGLVILGVNTPEDFPKNIEKKLKIDAKKTESLSRAFTEKIFNPILGDLKALVKPSAPIEISSVTNKNISSNLHLTKVEDEGVNTEKLTSPSPSLSLLRRENEEVSKPIKPVVVQTPPPAPTQVFAKPIPDPYREQISEINTTPLPKQRVVNWEGILKNKTKEPETHPEAKIALEKAMNDTIAMPPPISEKNIEIPKPAQPKYAGNKDPYHEPLE